MADEEDDDLDLRPADAGALFRAEMATTNFLMGYWKHLLAVVIFGLIAVLIYGKVIDHQNAQQRLWAEKIALAEADLGVPIIQAGGAMQAGELESGEVLEAARKLFAISQEADGAARVEGALKAAELFRLAGSVDEQRAALEDAVPHASGVLAYSAHGALANLDLEQGNGDAAVTRWQELIEGEEGYLAEQAMLELALAYEALGRVDEARQVYADFMAKYPNSVRKQKAEQRDARLAAGNG